MPGTVIKVLVAPDRGESASPFVLEAMKMETPLTAPYDAVVRTVNVAEGDQVAGGAVLVESRTRRVLSFMAAPMSPLILSFPVMRGGGVLLAAENLLVLRWSRSCSPPRLAVADGIAPSWRRRNHVPCLRSQDVAVHPGELGLIRSRRQSLEELACRLGHRAGPYYGTAISGSNCRRACVDGSSSVNASAASGAAALT